MESSIKKFLKKEPHGEKYIIDNLFFGVSTKFEFALQKVLSSKKQ